MLGLKLNHVSKRGPRLLPLLFILINVRRPDGSIQYGRWLSEKKFHQCSVHFLRQQCNLHFRQASYTIGTSWSIKLDDIMPWKCFPHYWPFARGTHWSPMASSKKYCVIFRIINLLNKQSSLQWFETPSRPCDVIAIAMAPAPTLTRHVKPWMIFMRKGLISPRTKLLCIHFALLISPDFHILACTIGARYNKV